MYTPAISRLLIVVVYLALDISAQSVKPDSFSDYQNARDCVKGCVYSALVDQAPDNLGCNQLNPVSCQCGTVGGVSSSLSLWIWTCASKGCGDDPEASSAVAIFNEYCVANLSPSAKPTPTGTSPAVTAAATPGATTVIVSSTATVTVKSSSSSLSTSLSSLTSLTTTSTQVPTSSSTSTATSTVIASTQGSKGLSTGDIIGIVTIVATIITAIAVGWWQNWWQDR